MSKESAAIYQAVTTFGQSLGTVSARDITELLDDRQLVLYTDKYGFKRVVNGYNSHTQKFYYVEAPIAYATSRWQTFIHLNRLGFQTAHSKPFDDFEYFGATVEPITGFGKWFLTRIMKLRLPFQ